MAQSHALASQLAKRLPFMHVPGTSRQYPTLHENKLYLLMAQSRALASQLAKRLSFT